MLLKDRFLFIIILFALILGALNSSAQKNQEFWDRYDRARLYIAKHNARKATKILEELHAVDSIDPNVSYLLGVSLIVQGVEAQRASLLFEKSEMNFDKLWDNPGVGPPEHLYYYMILAYVRIAECDKANASLKKFEELYSFEDQYYLIDGRKWANLCKEPTVKLLEVPDRLRKPDVKVKTRPHEFTTYSTLYGVQVAALLEPQMTRKFDGLKNVEVFVDLRGVYRYVIGNFIFRSQAEKMLEIVHSAGYPDAFVVNITDDERYPFEVVALDEHSPKKQIRGSVHYQVQIAAFKEALPDESARYYLMIDSITEMSHDDLTLLTVGNFKSYGNALERRNELHQMGFKDAYVVAFNEGRKVPIEDAMRYLRKFHD